MPCARAKQSAQVEQQLDNSVHYQENYNAKIMICFLMRSGSVKETNVHCLGS